jgi:hypothetical protein
MNLFWTICGIFWVTVSILYAWFEGSKRKPGFIGCLIIMLLFTPFFGYFIIESFSKKNAKGCKWCGNKYNEAVYCGMCGKNDDGDLRPGFVAKK